QFGVIGRNWRIFAIPAQNPRNLGDAECGRDLGVLFMAAGEAARDLNSDTRYGHKHSDREIVMRLWEGPETAQQPPLGTRVLALVTAAALAVAGFPVSAQAQGRGPPVIRDTEIEQLLRDYTQPILKAAGLAKQNVRVVIINDRSFNAFVADGRRIFINAGTIMVSETPNEVIGVLAHETGHMAGGHLARLREE